MCVDKFALLPGSGGAHVGRHFSPRQAAVSRDPPIPPGIPLVVFGIICNPYTSFILKLFSDLGDYFRATVVDWTWGLGRTALGGGAFACLKVSLPFNFLACIRATRLGWVEKSRQSCGRHSQTWRPSRFLNCLSLAQSCTCTACTIT